MSPDQIFAKYDGHGVDLDGLYGNQCKDWANAYANEIGHPLPAGNAIDMANRSIAGYTWIPEPVTPQKGDIVIWGTVIGPYGHIAVANGQGNFYSYDQNWPIGSVVHLQPHNHNGVLGVQRPDIQEEEMPKITSTGQVRDLYANFGITGFDGNDPALSNPVGSDELEFVLGIGAQVVNGQNALKKQLDDLAAENTQLHDQLIQSASQSPSETPQATVTTVSGASTLQTVISFLKGLWK